MDSGADPTITNMAGHDPVYEAERNDRSEVVEWVLKEGGEGLMSGMAGEGGNGEDEGDEEEGGASVEDGVAENGVEDGEREELDPELKARLSGLGFEEDKRV